MIAVYCRRVGKEGEEDSAQEEGVEGRWGRPHFEGAGSEEETRT